MQLSPSFFPGSSDEEFHPNRSRHPHVPERSIRALCATRRQPGHVRRRKRRLGDRHVCRWNAASFPHAAGNIFKNRLVRSYTLSVNIQENCNLIHYDKTNALVWSSGSGFEGNCPDAYLLVQDDGNLAIVTITGGQVIWAAGMKGERATTSTTTITTTTMTTTTTPAPTAPPKPPVIFRLLLLPALIDSPPQFLLESYYWQLLIDSPPQFQLEKLLLAAWGLLAHC